MISCQKIGCNKNFRTENSLMYHECYKHGKYPVSFSRDYICTLCGSSFYWEISLKSHEGNKNTLHRKAKKQRRRPEVRAHNSEDKDGTSMLTSYYNNKVVPSVEDRKESKEKVHEVLRKLMSQVRTSDGGDIYSANIRNAGSTATGTKINVADEFDFDIPLMIDSFKTSEPSSSGYVNVSTNQHNFQHLCKDGYIVTSKLKEELRNKLEYFSRNLTDVIVQRVPHGPAVTLSIHNAAGKIKHNIDVDLSPAIDLTNQFKIPGEAISRLNIVFARRPSIVSELKNTPLILVPKKNDSWLVSYSKVVKITMNRMDMAGECRKMCHKILKYDVKIIKSQSPAGFSEGISTHIFKHHLLWMNEKHMESGYWKSENVYTCYVDMLEDLIEKLDAEWLSNYFNPNENVLIGKSKNVLQRLASQLRKRRREIMQGNV